MFSDCRSKRVVFVAHCIINQNSISDGTAVFPGCCREVMEHLISSDVGIVQLPCPELMCLGLDRENSDGHLSPVVEENTRIRAAISTKEMGQKIQDLVQSVIYQIQEYKKYHFEILGIIGINRSPSCGVETTSDDNMEIKGRGVFVDSLAKAVKKHQLDINIVGIKPSEAEETAKTIKQFLKNSSNDLGQMEK